MRRVGSMIGLQPGAVQRYKELHAAVWPAVLKQIHASNIRNYSIYLHNNLLFAYFEYIGDDFAGDMAKMAADPMTQEWWAICSPMQTPLAEAQAGETWHTIEEVFHTD